MKSCHRVSIQLYIKEFWFTDKITQGKLSYEQVFKVGNKTILHTQVRLTVKKKQEKKKQGNSDKIFIEHLLCTIKPQYSI